MKKGVILFLIAVPFFSYGFKYEKYVKELESKGLPYFYNEDIEKSIEAWVKNENGVTQNIISKAGIYFQEIERIQKAAGIPWFCKYITAANTGLDLGFKEENGAAGIWPLPFYAGRKYSLVQNFYLDERYSVIKSTEAASQYLKDLQNIYKDWLKTVAAFKSGPVAINQTIHESGNKLEFSEIYSNLPEEAKWSIMQFYGAVVSMYFASDFGLIPVTQIRPNWEQVSTDVNLPFDLVNKFTGIEIAQLAYLNPEIRQDLIPYFGKTVDFKIPKEKKDIYLQYRDTMAFIVHEMEKPQFVVDTIITVIDSVENVEYTKREIEKGSNEKGKRIVKTFNTQTETVKSTEEYVWVYYTIKAGDGFFTLSDVFDCTIPQIKQWNGIYNNALIAGYSLKFYVKNTMKSYYQQINYMNYQQKRNLAAKD